MMVPSFGYASLYDLTSALSYSNNKYMVVKRNEYNTTKVEEKGRCSTPGIGYWFGWWGVKHGCTVFESANTIPIRRICNGKVTDVGMMAPLFFEITYNSFASACIFFLFHCHLKTFERLKKQTASNKISTLSDYSTDHYVYVRRWMTRSRTVQKRIFH